MYYQIFGQVACDCMKNNTVLPINRTDYGTSIQEKIEYSALVLLGNNGFTEVVIGNVRVGNSCVYS